MFDKLETVVNRYEQIAVELSRPETAGDNAVFTNNSSGGFGGAVYNEGTFTSKYATFGGANTNDCSYITLGGKTYKYYEFVPLGNYANNGGAIANFIFLKSF